MHSQNDFPVKWEIMKNTAINTEFYKYVKSDEHATNILYKINDVNEEWKDNIPQDLLDVWMDIPIESRKSAYIVAVNKGT